MKKVGIGILFFFGLVAGLYFLINGLMEAKTFLVPLSLALLLSMLLLPIANWFEKKGMSRGVASIFSDLFIVVFSMIILGIVSMQVKGFVEDWPQLKQKMRPKVEQAGSYLNRNFGVTLEDLETYFKKQASSGNGSSGESSGSAATNKKKEGSGSVPKGAITSTLTAFGGFMGSALLTYVYIFFILFYRRRFVRSILKMMPDNRRDFAADIIQRSVNVAQGYLGGRLILILFLAVIYSIGLSVTGIDFPILTSILAAMLSLIPFLGNVIGFVLAMALGLVSGSTEPFTVLIGVSLTFAVAQFVESYILEPFIVGGNVGLNAIFTIIAVIAGEAVWGIAGMVLAIPLLGIMKVFFDHIPPLEPLGFLIGNNENGNSHQDGSRLKRWGQKLTDRLRGK